MLPFLLLLGLILGSVFVSFFVSFFCGLIRDGRYICFRILLWQDSEVKCHIFVSDVKFLANIIHYFVLFVNPFLSTAIQFFIFAKNIPLGS